MKRIGVLAATALLAMQCAAPGSSAATPSSGAACAWPLLFSVATWNVGLPDAAAYYWLQPFKFESELSVDLKGRYPDARYFSISVYGSGGNSFNVDGASSSETDFQITPDAGSVNPWEQTAPAGGHFTVRLRGDVTGASTNVLPLAPTGTAAGTAGFALYRVYLPAGGDISKIDPPEWIQTTGGKSETLAPCKKHSNNLPAFKSPAPAPTTTPSPQSQGARQLQFFKPKAQTTGGGLPNNDTVYLLAYTAQPPSGDVIVITAKAPRSSTGERPAPWPAPGDDLRYWSMCVYVGAGGLPLVANHLPDGTTDSGCRFDEVTNVDSSGDYTFVIGTESQRAQIEQVAGVTFLPLPLQPAGLYLILFRNMLVNSASGYPAPLVPADGSPASAAREMGAYYPRTSLCPLGTLTAGGPGACLARS